ncbi:MAG: hypothetical protein AAGJ18_15405, partial [Bacteroidota bacterium]
RKRKPIKHLVIFLGKGTSKMETKLKASEIFTGFEIINIFKLDTQELLASQIPSYIVSAILTDIPKDQIEATLRGILVRLKQVCKNKSELYRYQKQLIILSRLRKFEEKATKIVYDMPITYDVETDYLYKKGMEKGIAKGEDKGIDQQATVTVLNLILKTDFNTVQIAKLAAVTRSFVKKLENSLTTVQAIMIWKNFGVLEEGSIKTKERATQLAVALIKADTLSDKVISKVCNLSEKTVQKLRLQNKHQG